jgi:hypothetical protein
VHHRQVVGKELIVSADHAVPFLPDDHGHRHHPGHCGLELARCAWQPKRLEGRFSGKFDSTIEDGLQRLVFNR